MQIVDSSQAHVIRPTISDVQLRTGQFLAVRTGDSARIVRRRAALGTAGAIGSRTIDTLVVLPFTYVGVAKDNRPVHLQPAIIRDLPLRYQPDAGVFRGSLLVGLQDSLAPAIRKEIGGAIPLTFASDGAADSISPNKVQIGYTNYPLESVIVIARNPLDSVSVRVIPQFDPRGTVVWLPVNPALVIDAPEKASGFGIETVTFLVRVIGASLKDSLPVTLAVDQGSLKEDRVMVGPAGSATVHLRSKGTGPAKITATSPGLNRATATIQFGWPISFLLAALLGGALGGATKHVRRIDRQDSGLPKSILVGVLIGLLVAVAYYAVDVNLLRLAISVPFFDEAAVFGLAMLGAYLGVRKVSATSTGSTVPS
ncbi:MAG: hypothetical protein M3P26_17975 [Gemmatimonadota bacterium]|nr:hypothetical protein [Gemmatimonadota bacterium]